MAETVTVGWVVWPEGHPELAVFTRYRVRVIVQQMIWWPKMRRFCRATQTINPQAVEMATMAERDIEQVFSEEPHVTRVP